MSTYRLDRLFAPRSIALVGASPREKSLGRIVLRNLREAGFSGPISLINPKYPEIDGHRALDSLGRVEQPPDVVIVAVPPDAVLSTIAAAADAGAATAIVLTAGLGHGEGSMAQAVRACARSRGLRVVGPNCLGVIVPGVNFNGSFAARMPNPGHLALISQSGGVAAAMLEWATERGIGFSAVASVGDQLDVDVGDLLDHFAVDYRTRAILLYVEAVTDARKFMSAARAAARVMPVVILKGGRQAAGAKAAATHTGALAGSDAVYDAAFRRAGLLRVDNLAELFSAAETLSRIRRLDGQRLAILTNGGGIGVLAVDHLATLGGTLAGLSPETRERLNKVLPATWSKSNPVDIIGDADADRYRAALAALLEDPANDAVLVVNVATAIAPSIDIANAVAEIAEAQRAKRRAKPILASWLGQSGATDARFRAAQVPSYATEADAVSGFMHLVRYNQAITALMATPPVTPRDLTPDVERARNVVKAALSEGRRWLDPIEVGELLAAYRVNTIPIRVCADAEQAASAASEFLSKGQAVVVKILSREIVHKSDVGGVRLDLTSVDAVRKAAAEMIERARLARPEAVIAGVTVQPMIVRPQARELIVGIANDPTFGPVVAFGHGGIGVEVINDKALALPPLDLRLAEELIARTRVSRILQSYRNTPAVDMTGVASVLVQIAQMAADFPEILELDINPLLADDSGVVALDARVAIAAPPAPSERHSRLSIRPYPAEWERSIALKGGRTCLVRPVKPQDEHLFQEFFTHVTSDDLRMRFFAPVKLFDHAFIARLTQLDYARAMAFVALNDQNKLLGAARLHADANYETAEYAILLRSDLKGQGLGWQLMGILIEYAYSEGLKSLTGQVLAENTTMLQMCRELGFDVVDDPDEGGIKRVTLELR